MTGAWMRRLTATGIVVSMFVLLCGEMRTLSDRLAAAENRLEGVERSLPRYSRAGAIPGRQAKPLPAPAVNDAGPVLHTTPAPAVEPLASIAAGGRRSDGRFEACARTPWADVLGRWRWLRCGQLNQLEAELKLSAFQMEQIAEVLEQESAELDRLLAGSGDHGLTGWEEIGRGTDSRVKRLLSPLQADRYDVWRAESGGWQGLQFGVSPGE